MGRFRRTGSSSGPCQDPDGLDPGLCIEPPAGNRTDRPTHFESYHGSCTWECSPLPIDSGSALVRPYPLIGQRRLCPRRPVSPRRLSEGDRHAQAENSLTIGGDSAGSRRRWTRPRGRFAVTHRRGYRGTRSLWPYWHSEVAAVGAPVGNRRRKRRSPGVTWASGRSRRSGSNRRPTHYESAARRWCTAWSSCATWCPGPPSSADDRRFGCSAFSRWWWPSSTSIASTKLQPNRSRIKTRAWMFRPARIDFQDPGC
jgi:hypothetical protein